MANFIEIRKGIAVNIEDIEAIIETSKDDKLSCKVYISGISYPSDIPKADLLRMIDSKGARKGKTVQEQMLNIMKQQTSFAG